MYKIVYFAVLSLLLFNHMSQSGNTVNWANTPNNNAVADSGTTWNKFDVFAEYDGNCGQNAVAEASGSCVLVGENGQITNRVERSAGRRCFEDKRINDYRFRMVAGDQNNALLKCDLYLYARHNSRGTGGRRVIKVAQKLFFNDLVISNLPYPFQVEVKTADGLKNTGQPVNIVNLTPQVCELSQGEVTNLTQGTCSFEISVAGTDDLAEITAIKSWVVSDQDGDGIYDESDNCVDDPNPNQIDSDGDLSGNACDSDDDNDDYPDSNDNCPTIPNYDQLNTDGDSLGNVCDADNDNDEVSDLLEIFSGTDPFDSLSFPDRDNDSIADNLEVDSDGDGISNLNEIGGNPYADIDNDGVPSFLDDNDNDAEIFNDNGIIEPQFFVRNQPEPAFLTADTSLSPQIIFVDEKATGNNDGTSWQDAFTDLSTALGFAGVAGDRLWVAQGKYTPSSVNPAASFIAKPGVSIYGGFFGASASFNGEISLAEAQPNFYKTVISGDIGGDDIGVFTQNSTDILGTNSQQVVKVLGALSTPSMMQGIYIVGGNANNTQGTALYLFNANLVLDSVTIQGHKGENLGDLGTIYASASAGQNTRLEITESTIAFNRAYQGGAIAVESGAEVIVKQSTLYQNLSQQQGAVLWAQGEDTNITMQNVTITENQSLAGLGNLYIAESAQVALAFVTLLTGIKNNQVFIDSPIRIEGTDSQLTLLASLVANLTDDLSNAASIDFQASKQIKDDGYNVLGLDGNSGVKVSGVDRFDLSFSNTSIANTADSMESLINTELGDDGGSTLTLPIREGSSLIDFAPASTCSDINEDQRGFARLSGSGCDVGAIEYTDADQICWDDGALERASSGNNNFDFCFSAGGGTIPEIFDNLVIGAMDLRFFGLFLMVIVLRLWHKKRYTVHV